MIILTRLNSFVAATIKGSVDEVPQLNIGKAKESEKQKFDVKKPVQKPLESP